MSTVVVTGATGYVASHTIKLLLEKGYKVIGTARTQQKADTLVSRFNNEIFNCMAIEDITRDGAHGKLFINKPENKYVLHIASPTGLAANETEKEVLIPVVEGTRSILKSIKLHAPQVERVVYTSSIIAYVRLEDMVNKDIIVNEKSWNPITKDIATFDTERTKRLLGLEYQKIDELLPETYSQLIDYRKIINQL